jgi:hypothetical protein
MVAIHERRLPRGLQERPGQEDLMAGAVVVDKKSWTRGIKYRCDENGTASHPSPPRRRFQPSTVLPYYRRKGFGAPSPFDRGNDDGHKRKKMQLSL